MKRVIALLTSLVCAVLFATAMAENTQTVSPLLRLYQAEQNLLFSTDNVTMTGHAVFTADGSIFKTADLTHTQDGSASVRDWVLLTPTPDGGDRETGYTVVCQNEHVDAYESYHHGHKWYYAEPARLRTSILRHTVASDTLTDMAAMFLAQCGSMGECSVEAGADGSTVISIHLTKDDIPALMNPILNSVLQYGITRYNGHDYMDDSVVFGADYTCYGTITEGLVICLNTVRLRELTVDAVLDDQDRIVSVSGALTLDYETKTGSAGNELRLDFEQSAVDYGTSRVSNDPSSYNHWGAPEIPTVPAEYVPLYDSTSESEATQQLLDGLYWNSEGGTRLHADQHCPTVSSDNLPLDKVELTPDLLLTHGLCPFCVDATPFLNDVGDASLDVAAADLMAALTYRDNYGMNELFYDLDAKYGLFNTWSYAQKHYFTAMLPTLAQREIERMEQYHPDFVPDTRLRDMLCIWSYGLPGEGDDVAARDVAAAYAPAQGIITPEQLDTLSVTCDYYTSSSFILPFANPWWVVRYGDETAPVCEVWLDNTLTDVHAVDVQRMKDIAIKTLMEQDPQLGGEPVSVEAIKDFCHYVLYDGEQWNYVIDSGFGSYWIVYLHDDDELTVGTTEGGNG